MRISQITYSALNSQRTFSKPNFKQISPLNKVKVSVILPVYNQEKYLETAINSLRNQSLKDIEIICVNDGSTDNSLNILNDYVQKDARIKLINQKNQGPGAARNTGLKAAKGEYIAFLDPDDWFEKNAMEELYNKAEKHNCDLIVFNFNKVGESGKFLGQYNLKTRLQRFYSLNEDENFTWHNVKPRVLGGLHPAAWNKLYKRELIRNHKLHFAKSSLAEDNVFVFGAALNAKSIGYSDKCYYNYLIRNDSAIRTRSDKNFCIFKSIDSVKKLITDMGLMNELKNEFDGYVLRFVSYHIKQIASVSKFKEICKKRLSPAQNRMLNERYEANSKLLPVLNSLLAQKLKK